MSDYSEIPWSLNDLTAEAVDLVETGRFAGFPGTRLQIAAAIRELCPEMDEMLRERARRIREEAA